MEVPALLSTIFYNLRSIARFDGRDDRARFWPYVGFVFFLNFAVSALLMLPEMARSFARMQEFAARNPDKARIERGPGQYSIRIEGHHPELMPDMGTFFIGLQVLTVASIILLAAAVARRLHDTGRSGFWGLMPLPFLAAGLFLMPRILGIMADRQPDFGWFMLGFANNMIYLALLALLGFLLSRKGAEGANRYGPQPAG